MKNYFYVRREKRYEKVAFDDIILIKGRTNYIQIVTEQQTLLVMNSLSEVARHLPASLFCRIHHRYIVALQRVKSFDRKTVHLHEAPADKPFRMGLARLKELPLGRYYQPKLFGSVIKLDCKTSRAKLSSLVNG